MAFDLTTKALQQLFSDLYAVYLKTQNYHWHVVGHNFKLLHELFEGQYKKLAEHIDSVAERLVMLGVRVPATFKNIVAMTNISDGDAGYSWQKMFSDLAEDQKKIIAKIQVVLEAANKEDDEGTISILSSYIAHYQKTLWFLENHLK